jgi:Domain of unknown function (DUF5615)
LIDTTAMHLVLDQGVPRDAAAQLRALGYRCTHVGEIGMSKAADDEILAWSLGQNATVVTLDADFHAILAVTGECTFRDSNPHAGFGRTGSGGVSSKRTRCLPGRSEERLSGNSQGAQEYMS